MNEAASFWGVSIYRKGIRRKLYVILRRSYQARLFPFTTKLPGPSFSIFDEVTRLFLFTTNLPDPSFFHLRRNNVNRFNHLRQSYQYRVIFTRILPRLTLNPENEIRNPQSHISSNIISSFLLLLALSPT